MPTITERFKKGWNAFFKNRDPTNTPYYMPPPVVYENLGSGNSARPDRIRLTRGNERSFITAIFNRIATDIASIEIKHVRLDENGRYKETIEDDLNNALTLDANLDQTGIAFRHDAILSLFDEGAIAIVPTDLDSDPINGKESLKIFELRVGQIVEWYPYHVRVRVYNEHTGRKEEIVLPKRIVAIIENPFYSIMNEPNSTFKRLIRKLNLLDVLDGQASSGKLDLIIQLPYVIKSDARRQQAEARRKDIEMQLSSSKYGIAYTDGTEKITQLNRAVENNILPQIEYLTKELLSQLGMTEEILNGTASDAAMLNYYNRINEPVLTAIVDEMKRKFLTKTARTQGQSIMFFRDPFKLVPVSQIAEIGDKMTRNEILSSNELRGILGFKPVDDPRADKLINKNLNQPVEEINPAKTAENQPEEMEVTEDA